MRAVEQARWLRRGWQARARRPPVCRSLHIGLSSSSSLPSSRRPRVLQVRAGAWVRGAGSNSLDPLFRCTPRGVWTRLPCPALLQEQQGFVYGTWGHQASSQRGRSAATPAAGSAPPAAGSQLAESNTRLRDVKEAQSLSDLLGLVGSWQLAEDTGLDTLLVLSPAMALATFRCGRGSCCVQAPGWGAVGFGILGQAARRARTLHQAGVCAHLQAVHVGGQQPAG